jgi:hypothetical protein
MINADSIETPFGAWYARTNENPKLVGKLSTYFVGDIETLPDDEGLMMSLQKIDYSTGEMILDGDTNAYVFHDKYIPLMTVKGENMDVKKGDIVDILFDGNVPIVLCDYIINDDLHPEEEPENDEWNYNDLRLGLRGIHTKKDYILIPKEHVVFNESFADLVDDVANDVYKFSKSVVDEIFKGIKCL